MRWQLIVKEREHGPYDEDQLRDLIRQGMVTPQTQLRPEDGEEPVPAAEFPDLFVRPSSNSAPSSRTFGTPDADAKLERSMLATVASKVASAADEAQRRVADRIERRSGRRPDRDRDPKRPSAPSTVPVDPGAEKGSTDTEGESEQTAAAQATWRDRYEQLAAGWLPTVLVCCAASNLVLATMPPAKWDHLLPWLLMVDAFAWMPWVLGFGLLAFDAWHIGVRRLPLSRLPLKGPERWSYVTWLVSALVFFPVTVPAYAWLRNRLRAQVQLTEVVGSFPDRAARKDEQPVQAIDGVDLVAKRRPALGIQAVFLIAWIVAVVITPAWTRAHFSAVVEDYLAAEEGLP